MPASARLTLLVATGLLLVGCSGAPSPSPSPAASPSPSAAIVPSPSPSPSPRAAPLAGIGLELAVGGFERPVYVTGAGDGSGRLFVVEQAGRIWIVRDGQTDPEPFLDITDRVNSSGNEQGLLGLAFPPDFGTANDRVWVHYSDGAGDTMISSFKLVTDDPDRLDPASERPTFQTEQPYSNHNGGWIGFGPDAMLYIALGDGGAGGDPHGNGQTVATPLGKLLRIDVLTPTGGDSGEHLVPSDNPFVDQMGAEPRIWAYGLRNPWRVSFDRETGDLWIGDVGQGAWEEINRAPAAAGGGRGANYGWSVTEGRHCYSPPSGCSTDAITMPIAEYGHDQGCTVIGGYVYRGAVWPDVQGTYVFGDICSGLIWGLDADGPDSQEPVLLLESNHEISSFGEDDAGELYLTDLGSGSVFRLTGGAN